MKKVWIFHIFRVLFRETLWTFLFLFRLMKEEELILLIYIYYMMFPPNRRGVMPFVDAATLEFLTTIDSMYVCLVKGSRSNYKRRGLRRCKNNTKKKKKKPIMMHNEVFSTSFWNISLPRSGFRTTMRVDCSFPLKKNDPESLGVVPPYSIFHH